MALVVEGITILQYVILEPGEPPVLQEDLTDEQIEYCRKRTSENSARAMSAYYTQHPEEYAALPEDLI